MIAQNTNRDMLIVGTGYVGLVTAICMAKMGHTATCYDINPERVSQLKQGKSPFYEPDVSELLAAGLESRRVIISDSLSEAYTGQRYIFVAVQTPQDAEGKSDLTALRAAVTSVAETVSADKQTLIIVKSTVPVGVFDELAALPAVQQNGALTFVSCPEFLAEGTAVRDFFHPMRTIVGADDKALAEEVAGLFYGLGGSFIITDAKTAQMIKYGANSFLATRVAFINDMAEVCEKVGVNVNDVAQALVMDPRVGGTYLWPSIGFGGPCLPKDIAALIETSERVGAPTLLLRGASEHNVSHVRHIVDSIIKAAGEGRTVAVFGLSFKPNTDDVRNAFSLRIAQALLEHGLAIRATDPQAVPAAKLMLGDTAVQFFDDPFEAARDSDVQVFLTPWEQYEAIDLPKLASVVRTKAIYDGMQVIAASKARAAGFSYQGVGNAFGHHEPPTFEVSENPRDQR
ncbi:MAG TPA: UDP-glucose/GDP-mannose dehydrogenase family protein [Candidatus Saccharimonadales bacterium]|jgi:UDPglucose 6-dehydrogenase|nr:UDP-glucose/GDP-mannose dehydrogenase family protein [Candidatus Saccharimonadales bacterium]